MLKRVQQTIHRHALLADGARVVVGVSGGPDSMALLDVLVHAARTHDYTLHVAHVHYGIRGDEARRDRDRAAHAAQTYGLSFYAHDLSGTDHPTDEAWMRTERYTFFDTVCAKTDADTIAVGHTQDDLVETFFLHLLRGSGLGGLSALAHKRDHIVRPLLDISRKDVLAYCAAHDIPFGIDSTNADTTYLRNRIRHDLIPHLRTQYNPHITTTVSRLAHSISDDYATLSTYAEHHLPTHTQTDDTITFDAADFSTLSPSLQRMTLRIFSTRLHGSAPDFSAIEELRKALASTKNKTQTVRTNGLIMTKNGARVSMTLCSHE